jgi:hypothetical protein
MKDRNESVDPQSQRRYQKLVMKLENRLLRSAVLLAVLMVASCETQQHHDYAELVSPVRGLPRSAYSQSIHHSDLKIDPLVTNGDCYEKFQIAVPGSITTVLLPPGTTAIRQDGELLVGFIKKSLAWAGHPGDTKTSIDDERLKMGLAMKIKGRTLLITSFGAWSSFEGGSDVTVLAGVPSRVSIRRARNQPEQRSAEGLALEGWFVVPSRPALKDDYDRFTEQ